MGRWREPEKPGSPYITTNGYDNLQQELKNLKVKRAHVTEALATAAAEGDRSENAEYIYRKKELAGIDRRIRYLIKRLPKLKIISKIPDDPESIYFGAWVELIDDENNTRCYRIVGPDETDFDKGWISMDSPVARALQKKTVNDEVIVDAPHGKISYLISSVRYT